MTHMVEKPSNDVIRKNQLGFIKLVYVNRALEWINICSLFLQVLMYF
jgi:hypothetical protein